MDYRKQYLVTPDLLKIKNILISESVNKYSATFKSNLLQHLLKSAIGFGPKVIQGIYDEPESIIFENMEFVLTGGFSHGSKPEIAEMISNRNGIVSPRTRKSTDYLIVGGEGSLEYSHGVYGNKIAFALDSKKTYKPILILEEDFLLKFILSDEAQK